MAALIHICTYIQLNCILKHFSSLMGKGILEAKLDGRGSDGAIISIWHVGR